MSGEPMLPWLRGPLERALAQRAHALLIHGPSGVGQFELGLAFAGALLCEGEPPRPCDACAGCRLVRARAHPDLKVLLPEALTVALGWSDAEDERDGAKARAKPSREIRVDAVREAIGWAQQTPSRGASKVLLIHPAQAMNAVTANALLKTLEEPPPSLRLVLCGSDPELLLPTIRSRCQRLRLDLPPVPDALGWLRGQGMADAEALLRAAGGRPLDALALAAEGIDAARWSALPRRVARGDAAVFGGWAVPRIVETLQKLCHDAMAQAVGAEPRYFDAASLPEAAPVAALADWSRALVRIAARDEHPWQVPLLVEALVIEACSALRSAQSPGSHFDTLAAR